MFDDFILSSPKCIQSFIAEGSIRLSNLGRADVSSVVTEELHWIQLVFLYCHHSITEYVPRNTYF